MYGSELVYLRVKQHKLQSAALALYRECNLLGELKWASIAWWAWSMGLIDDYECDLMLLDLHS